MPLDGRPMPYPAWLMLDVPIVEEGWELYAPADGMGVADEGVACEEGV